MPTLSYNILYKKSGSPLSPSDIMNRYFFGIPIKDQSGNEMSDDIIQFYIDAAIQELEGYLDIKIKKQVFSESLDYNYNDYMAWGFIPTSYPVIKIHSLTGYIGETKQIQYPTDWLSVKKTDDAGGYHRAIYLVPNGSSDANYEGVLYSGITPHLGMLGYSNIPNYWRVSYCTSFQKVPADIIDFIGKLSSLNIFNQLGDIILGAGIASQSIGIDGLSQSIATTSSATNAGYGARITEYINEMKLSAPKLKAKYSGMNLMSL